MELRGAARVNLATLPANDIIGLYAARKTFRQELACWFNICQGLDFTPHSGIDQDLIILGLCA